MRSVMTQDEDDVLTTPVTIRLTEEQVTKAERVTAMIKRITGIEPSKSAVYRQAVERGLRAMERDNRVTFDLMEGMEGDNE